MKQAIQDSSDLQRRISAGLLSGDYAASDARVLIREFYESLEELTPMERHWGARGMRTYEQALPRDDSDEELRKWRARYKQLAALWEEAGASDDD